MPGSGPIMSRDAAVSTPPPGVEGERRRPPHAPDASPEAQKFTAARVMISIVPREPSSIEILAIALLSGASTTFT